MTKAAAVSYCLFENWIYKVEGNFGHESTVSGLQIMEALKKGKNFPGFLDYMKKKGSILKN